MSLKNRDLSKINFSLKGYKLPPIEKREEYKPVKIDSPPSFEEINYSKLIKKNDIFESLVEALGLVSKATGKPLKKIELKEEEIEPYIKAQEEDKSKLIALARKVIKMEQSYTKTEIIGHIKKSTKVNQERAEKGFNLMLEAGAFEPTLGDRYYLTGSTPF